MTAERRIVLALLAAMMLSACGAGTEEAEPAQQPPPVEDTAFGDMVGTIDKAKAVQDTVDVHKQEMDRRIEEGEEAP